MQSEGLFVIINVTYGYFFLRRSSYYDTDTGLYYLQSRYYDPEIGRFINADVFVSTDITGPLSANMYAYCENNPVNASDPNGAFWHIVAGAVIGAVVNVATSYFTHAVNGTEYKTSDLLTDALIGAASGALASTGLGRVGQAIGNATISGISKAVELKDETDWKKAGIEIAKSVMIGAACGYIGGDGLTNKSSVAKQVSIIDSNVHCVCKSSAWNSVKTSAKRIYSDFIECLGGFTKASFISNIYNQIGG